MIFNSDAGKQAQEVMFRRKMKKNTTYPPLIFNNVIVSHTNSQKNYKLPCNVEAKLEEIIAIVTTHSVFLFINKIC